jgi:DEAD/DEAH box helicase
MASLSSSEELLLDPELLKGLTEDEKQEALQAAAAAKRAEERAEQRALELAMKRKEEERKLELQREQLDRHQGNTDGQKNQKQKQGLGSADDATTNGTTSVVFIPKRNRSQLRQEEPKEQQPKPQPQPLDTTTTQKKLNDPPKRKEPPASAATSSNQSAWSQRTSEAVKKSYLGKSVEDLEEERAEKRKKARVNKKITFKFKWDEEDDTFQDEDPLYTSLRKYPSQNNKTRQDRKKDALSGMSSTSYDTVRNKPIAKMTPRDWRILRENYEITVKGGKAPPPLRSFRENPLPSSELPSLHPSLLDALENVMHFQEPTPIQRQAIPIGLQRRDLIGIAETGSGKTVAFGVPICNYLIHLPSHVLTRVAEQGPLALIMAPTREVRTNIFLLFHATFSPVSLVAVVWLTPPRSFCLSCLSSCFFLLHIFIPSFSLPCKSTRNSANYCRDKNTLGIAVSLEGKTFSSRQMTCARGFTLLWVPQVESTSALKRHTWY